MNHRDLWFVGLLALAYLYLDAGTPQGRSSAPRLAPPSDPEGLTGPDGCPRDLSHPVRRRGDGAKWCLSCDEAFYPLAIIS